MQACGQWNRIPILILIDSNLEPDRKQAIIDLCQEPDAGITELKSVSEVIPSILESMKNDGYARKIKDDDMPYELSDNVMQLAIMKAFRRIRNDVVVLLSDEPAEPYGQINHTVKTSRDYKRIVEEYMSIQDPYTLQALYNMKKVPPAAYMVVDLAANPKATLEFVKTISASQVLAVTIGYELSAHNTVAVLDVGEEVCTAEELAEEVMSQAMSLFEKVKRDNVLT